MKATPDVPPVLRALVTELLAESEEAKRVPEAPHAAGDWSLDVEMQWRAERLRGIAGRLNEIAGTLEDGWKVKAVEALPKPTVPEVLPLVRDLYARPNGGAGCCLHIVIDDGNVDDDSVAHCLSLARLDGHADCERLAKLLALMSKTQRQKLYSIRTT